MLRPLLIVVLAGALCSCSTSYKTAPSTAPVATYVASARTASTSGKERVVSAEASVKANQIEAQSVNLSITQARVSLAAKDYPTVDAHLVRALIDNTAVMKGNEATARDLEAARHAFDQVSFNLDGAKTEIGTLQKTIDKQTVDGASDHEIAERCKSWYGLGAIFYGIEHLLKAGIVGILIFIAVIIVLFLVGTFVGGPVGGVILGWFHSAFSALKNRKQSTS